MTVRETRESIEAAGRLIVSAPDIKPFADLSAEVEEYELMLDDWVAYNKSPVGTFLQRCEKKGRTCSWPTIVYYDEGDVQQGCFSRRKRPRG